MSKDNFFDSKTELNENEKAQLVEILTKRCGLKVFNRIRSLVTYDLSTLINDGFLRRFYERDGQIHYCAGQSYPCEIRRIRQDILRRYP